MDHCRPLKDYEQRRQNFTLYLMIFLTISFWGRVDGTYIFQIEIKQKCSAKTIIIQGGFFLLVRLIFSAKMKNYGQPIRYESFATVGEIRVYRRADFQSGSRVLKKVF